MSRVELRAALTAGRFHRTRHKSPASTSLPAAERATMTGGLVPPVIVRCHHGVCCVTLRGLTAIRGTALEKFVTSRSA